MKHKSNKDKIKEVFEKVAKNIQTIVDNGDYERFLKFQKKLGMFNKYSFNNLVLIFSQFPEATRVARKENLVRTWKRN